MLQLELKDSDVGPRGACGSWLRVPVAAKGITTGRFRVKGRGPPHHHDKPQIRV